ncbi:MAG: tetratricopeptide repeat protein [candidate division Zixibacteria bacterium]|nr:tetratricopeptide repeat protein [candidate division Zixibacteria bacterium]
MKKVIIIGLLIIAVVTTVYALFPYQEVTTSSEKAYSYYLSGLESGYKMYYPEAIEAFRNAVKEDPSFAMAHLLLGKYLRYTGEGQLGRREIEIADSLKGKVSEREQLLIGYHYARLNDDSSQADLLLLDLLKMYPQTVEPHEELAREYQAEAKFDSAISEFRKIIDIEKNYAEAYNELTYFYLNKGDFAEALTNVEKYSFICSNQPNPFDTKGEVLLTSGKYDEAIAAFSHSIELKSDFIFGWMHLAAAYTEVGRFNDAEQCWSKYLEIGASDAEQLWGKRQKAGLEVLRGNFKKALKVYKDAADNEMLKSDPGVYFDLGLTHTGLGDIKAARNQLKHLSEMLKENPGRLDIEYYYNKLMAEIGLAQGDYTKAREAMMKAIDMISIPHQNVFNYAKLAEIEMKAGLVDNASQTVNGGLAFNSNHPRSLSILTQIYSEKGNTKAVRKTAEKYLQIMAKADAGHPEVIKIESFLN